MNVTEREHLLILLDGWWLKRNRGHLLRFYNVLYRSNLFDLMFLPTHPQINHEPFSVQDLEDWEDSPRRITSLE